MYRMVFIKVLCRLTLKIGLIPALLCVSCTSYRAFQVEVLEPAKVTLEKGKVMGYWDRNIRPQSDTVLVLGRYPGISSDELSYVFYSALQSALNEETETDTLRFIAGKDKVYLPVNRQPAPVSAENLSKIGDRFGMDYVVVLEKIGYTLDVSEQNVNCNLFVRLYDCRQGRVLDSVIYENDLTEGLVNEYGLAEYVNGMIMDRGTDYARHLKPYWHTVDRRIYNTGKVLKLGDIFFVRNDREQARKLWEAATRLSFKQAVRGYLNLAWLYENEGDFSMAEQMLQRGLNRANEKSLDNTDVDYLKEYLKIILKRIQDSSSLEKQL